jgi:hypothetical protein
VSQKEIRAEIKKCASALERVRADRDAALAEITKNGLNVVVRVLDSHGRAIKKLGVNPASKILLACERLEKILLARLKLLTDELKKIAERKQPNPWARFAPRERKSKK